MGTGALKTELVVALDVPSAKKAEALIQQLKGLPVIYKVGLELFLAAGPAWVKQLTESGQRVFLDLKFHDIPNTVGQAVIQATRLGAEFVTIHLAGGKRMLDEIEICFKEAEISGEISFRPTVLGVSILTSFQEEDWIASVSQVAKLGSVRSIEDAVIRYAMLSHDHPAIGGMVCSPKEVETVRLKYPQLYLMVPGIRPRGSAIHDQNRVMTPKEAMTAGASAIVVGRPIVQAENPREMAELILREIL